MRAIKKNRVYSEPFKRELVNLFESGKFSVPQLEQLYGVSNPTIYNWIYKYSTFNKRGYRVMEKKDSSTTKLNELSKKVKSLEQAVGQKQMQIEYLEKLIDLAKDDLQIDLKKNYDTQHSNGLGEIKKA
jgi:transposase